MIKAIIKSYATTYIQTLQCYSRVLYRSPVENRSYWHPSTSILNDGATRRSPTTPTCITYDPGHPYIDTEYNDADDGGAL